MWVAILYSGMLRTWAQCWPKMHAVLRRRYPTLRMRLFFSVWSVAGQSYKHWNKTRAEMRPPPDLWTDTDVTEVKIRELAESFPGVEVAVVDIEPFAVSETLMETSLARAQQPVLFPDTYREMVSSYSKLYRVWTLCRQWERQHDVSSHAWYLRCRPDGYIQQCPNLARPLRPVAFLNLYAWDVRVLASVDTLVNENAWWTNAPKMMDQMCNLVAALDTFPARRVTCPEQILAYHWSQQGLGPFVRYFDMELSVLRAHGFSQTAGHPRTWQ